jgi:hypothetical protein
MVLLCRLRAELGPYSSSGHNVGGTAMPHVSRNLGAFFATGSLWACTPSSLTWQQLSPVRDSTVITAAQLYARTDATTRAKAPANADKILIIPGGDSLIAAISIYELEDIFWLDAYVYNGLSTPYVVNPSQLVLLDGTRQVFRPLQPHEAANIYMGRVTNIPPYQPKYTYDVQSSTQGYLYAYGNYGTYTGTTQTTVTPREDPYNSLGYSIGAAIAAGRNKKFRNMAGTLYSVGFVEGSSIPSQAGARGGVYWLKRPHWQGPLILRFLPSGYEVRFSPNSP